MRVSRWRLGELMVAVFLVTMATSVGLAAPPAPTGLTATAASSTLINVSWKAPTGAVKYQLYRGRQLSNFSWRTTTTALSFKDSAVLPNTLYYYKVRAVDATGAVSPFSAIVNVKTPSSLPPPPPPPPTDCMATAGAVAVTDYGQFIPNDTAARGVNTSTINAALDAGGIICLPAGVFYLGNRAGWPHEATAIAITKSDVTLWGAGKGVTILHTVSLF